MHCMHAGKYADSIVDDSTDVVLLAPYFTFMVPPPHLCSTSFLALWWSLCSCLFSDRVEG